MTRTDRPGFVRLPFTWILALGLTAATLPAAGAQPLAPTAEHARTTALVTRLIDKQHYLDVGLDDALSERTLERYLESLDPTRSYFLAEDIESFARYRTRLDDALRQARLEPAFRIFQVFTGRLAERGRFALAQLQGRFDFSRDESFPVDRKGALWARDAAELDDLWRRRVKNDMLNLILAGRTEAEAVETLRRRYQGLVRRAEQFNADDVYQTFMNAFAASIEPHTAYLSPRSSENFQIQLSLSLEGIGAALQSEDDYTVVQRVIPGGPASLSGQLQAEDRITAVGQGSTGPLVDVVGWRLDDVVELIRGRKGSTVRIEILPKGAPDTGPRRVLSLVRDRIRLEEQAAKGSVVEVFGAYGVPRRIGVIDIPTFYLDTAGRARGDPDYRSTTRDVARILDELGQEHVDGVLIDLRGDGGGALSEAVDLTGLFISTGAVVQVRDARGRVQTLEDNDPTVRYRGPLAVLVDRHSASASEIFAAAIQDYGRGLVLGEPTFGKGTVQSLLELSRFARAGSGDLGQLKATVAQFFRVTGDSTQHKGVTPDILFPTAVDPTEVGERSLPNAIPWARVAPLPFRTMGDLAPYVREVRSRHQLRVATDPAFRWLLEEGKAERAAQSRTVVSLLEASRRAERDAARRAQVERENLLRKARGLPLLSVASEPPTGATGDRETDKEKAIQDKDVWLGEATQVLSDLLDVMQSSPAVQTAGRDDASSPLCLPFDCAPEAYR